MAYQFSLAEVAWLTSATGVLDELATLPLTSDSRLSDVSAARRIAGEFAACALETAMLRRKAAVKLDDAARWLFTEDAAQQATASAVTRHRAERLRDRVVHDVTCSVGADLSGLLSVAQRVIGSDLDPVRLAMARHNLGPAVTLVRADALQPVSRGTVVVADPARRSSGRRTWKPQDFSPPLDGLVSAYPDRDLVVKCAPGIDFDSVPWAAEIEIVSLAGSVRESALWSPGLASPGVRRRATVLTGDGSWTLTDAESDDCAVTEPRRWVIDPDGAVVRAGLVRHYAARHGLSQVDEHIAYLTGDSVPLGVRAFEVHSWGKYTEKSLKAELRARGVGKLEILVRGLDVDPNSLRPRLSLRGAGSATVVLTRIGRTPTALLCTPNR
ncbi:class I SAM-dependent methyltransferase [Pseudonocardiaceae bacterium YIM PH 21723]|nr:class I SAM-dependent methyltransferase [Pseudonocardiaceae bacterium YIM PH 21723]